MSAAKKAGQRSRLLARQRPTDTYHLPVEDDTAARAELAAAREALESARMLADGPADKTVADAEKRVQVAREAVEACYEPITFTALSPADFEALVAAHPPREGQDEQWNPETFPPACFLACVTTGELSTEEWEKFLAGSVSQAERTALCATAIGINARWPSGSIPND